MRPPVLMPPSSWPTPPPHQPSPRPATTAPSPATSPPVGVTSHRHRRRILQRHLVLDHPRRRVVSPIASANVAASPTAAITASTWPISGMASSHSFRPFIGNDDACHFRPEGVRDDGEDDLRDDRPEGEQGVPDVGGAPAVAGDVPAVAEPAATAAATASVVVKVVIRVMPSTASLNDADVVVDESSDGGEGGRDHDVGEQGEA